MSDEILDDMSLSDDDLLDSLADDLLLEMDEREDTQSRAPAAVCTSTTRPLPSLRPATPTANAVARPAAMPDMGHLMSQMMPMMAQMLNGRSGASPMFGGGSGHSLHPHAAVAWQELVTRHVPSNEQADWLTTIDKDATALRVASASGLLTKPLSRSYRTKASPLPTDHMEVSAMLAAMLTEAVRSAQLEPNSTWQAMAKDVVAHLSKTGMLDVFETEFKERLRQRVVNDLDFTAEKTSGRYCNITDALSV
ncbi:unnamed protein product [Hyaloperonospora brassicae]|uniref:Uncharacterized protein n=1 Tax=Hyaloperonospora brassicae TaxID=162125 RepID=A0AAV0ULU9_HYABA|nr:unnamed protein product [Hyaloperonospora brassicae]